MRNGRIITIALLLALAFGISGGCSNGGGGGGDDEEPEPQKPVFDLETAIDLGELSLVAYNQLRECIASGKDAITVPAPWTLEEVIYESADSTFNDTCLDDEGVVPMAFIATEGNSIYLAFRGTSNLSDALSDALALQVDYDLIPDGGMVSGGFLGVYEGTDSFPVEADILSKLDELLMTGDYENLYITGHSLGGALAALAFPDLSQNASAPNVFMYSFAGPAVGNSDFISAYEGEYGINRVSWRIVNTNDLVPKLPPLGLDCPDFMYGHVSGEYQITFGVGLPALPDFSADDCDLITIGAQVVTYGLNNQDGIIEDHKLCTYFMTLCEMGSDPSTCAERAIGCGSAESP
jgi:lipase (class 3)